MSFLQELAEFRPTAETLKVKVIEGEPDLEFRSPTEGETEAVRADAEHEAGVYFKEGYTPSPQQSEWLPRLKESFVRATVLSRFIVHESEKKGEARRLLCQVAKHRPLVFDSIYRQFIEKSVIAEVKDFADKVDEAKKSSLMTGTDFTD